MNKKTITELINDPTMLNKAKAGVSFNNDDRQFLERQYNGIVNYLKDKLTESQRFLAEILIDNNAKIADKMDLILGAISELKRDIKELRIEVKDIRMEVKELKVEVKGINLDLLLIHKKLLEHEDRIKNVEKGLIK